MQYEKLELSIDDLSLDQENPRIGEVSSQSDALEAIVRLSARNFRNMMKSIKDHGLDPGDAFYLIDDEENGGYTVVDGNRRLAALLILKNPLLLKGTQLPETMTRLLLKEVAGFELPSDFTVSTVLFESRADAGEWIERRHGKGMDGEGRIAWGALEIQRFQHDHTVLDVIGFVERNSTFADDQWARIKSSVEKNTSSLKRFLDSKAGRQFLGFLAGEQGTSPHPGPSFTKDSSYMIDVLTQIFLDIDAGTINTRTHNKASDIEEYFEELPAQIKKKGIPSGTPKPYSSTDVADDKKRPRQSPKSSPQPSKKSARIPSVRKTLAPARHTFAAPETEKGKQLIREASRLRLKETPLACAFCFRALIEHAVDTYMRKNGMSPTEDGADLKLSVRVERVISDITQNGRAPKGDLAPIKATLTAKNGPMSVGALNGYIHSKVQLPTGDDLRVAWEHGIPLFTAVFGPAK